MTPEAKWPASKIFSLLMIAATAGLSLWARPQITDGPVGTHFDLSGTANGFMPRDQALMVMPLTLAAITLLLWVLPYMQPKTGKLERSASVYAVSWIGVVALLAFGHLFIVGHALAWTLSVQPLLLGPGLLFILIGNVLPKARRNYVMGVRTPWTLSDERVWDRTHRLAGPVMMLAGVIMLGAALILPPVYLLWVFLISGIGSALIVLVASYIYARALKLT
ncbi:SdpI family protein [Asticcacaulis sp. DW145]|jgi:uncharacterized membrane protein|uniref:SdpI family protein n=1 Tax=Asticcacaulis currens TaxID=2984210 RepID=A0ABT5IA94_9CAUL|nr:SdpI family protein [Asticcacaulis currens]MDC7693112.1 SdpI family protein [Asticcacaulis currens]BEV09704.1 SdpI family protein [Asticcacaulis sp. DW145]